MTTPNRPYILLSAAASIDGYIDDATDQRLLLSNDEDFDRVDAERASVDAILVGAGTIRADNPRLLVRSEQRQKERTAAGKPASPIKVVITGSGNLDPATKFFTTGDNQKIVYTSSRSHNQANNQLGAVATVVDAGDPIDLETVLADLTDRGVNRLMIEGGGTIHTQFLAAGLADEIQLVIAPFLIGTSAAPRFTGEATYPQNPANPLTLTETRQIGNVVLLRYLAAP